MSIRANHLKESIERKIEISQARNALERRERAENVREEDIITHQKSAQIKLNMVMSNRKLVMAAQSLRRPMTKRVTVAMLNNSLLNNSMSSASKGNLDHSFVSTQY